MTTNHVWEGLRHHVTVDELRDYWAPSAPCPMSNAAWAPAATLFLVYGKYDPTMLPELTRNMLDSLRRHGADPRTSNSLAAITPSNSPPSPTSPAYRMLTFFLESLPSSAGFSLC